MKHTEAEVRNLKNRHIEMWNLVETQITGAFEAFRNFDRNKAREILARERVVNAQELIVDHHCENFIALFAPVAIDLRFVISLLKITNNLERLGDFAESIALFVLYQQQNALPAELVEKLKIDTMMDTALEMLSKARQALIEENSSIACSVLSMDEVIDKINTDAVPTLAQHIVDHPNQGVEMLHLHAIIRRIERIGDRVSNIAEDTVFYIDAKELRHTKELKHPEK